MHNTRTVSQSDIKNILVVGAGIAGPIVCYWLKQAGFFPTLIEKSSALRQGGHAIDIRGIAIQIVKAMGIYEKICNQRTQIETSRFVDTDGNVRLEEQGEIAGIRQGEEVEIVRGDLIEILMEAIPGVPVRFQQSLEHIEQQDDGVEVHFKDGNVEKYDLLIGCDGLHSSTRKIVFSEAEQRLKNLGYYISVYSLPNDLHLNHSEILFERGEKMVNISSDKDPSKAFAGFMFRSQLSLKEPRDPKAQKNFLREQFNHLGWKTDSILAYLDQSDDFYFDSIMQVIMPCWSKGRVALVGDAGYCASPLSGQGTSLALVGAYLLAGELNAAAGDYSLAFERYNALLRPFVDANQAFGDWVSHHFLVAENEFRETEEQRNHAIMEKMQHAANAISLPEYLALLK